MTPIAALLVCAVTVADWGTIRVDAEGVPLPPGVVSRIGSTRFRFAGDLIELRYTPDERWLIGLTSRSLYVWNAQTGLRHAMHTGLRPIARMAMEANGSVALIVRQGNGLQHVRMDSLTGEILARHALPEDYDDIIISHDGTRIAMRSAGLVKVFDTKTWEMVGEFRFSISDISPDQFFFSSDARLIGGVFGQNWTEVREVATGNEPYSATTGDADSQVQEAIFTLDSRSIQRLIYSDVSGYRIEQVELATEKSQIIWRSRDPKIRWGGLISSANDRTLDFAEGTCFKSVERTTNRVREHKLGFPTIIGRTALSPDGKRIALALSNGSIRILDSETLAVLPQSSDDLDSQSLSGRFIGRSSQLLLEGKGFFQIADRNTGRILKDYHGALSKAQCEPQIAVSPDGERYVVATEDAVTIRDRDSDKVLHEFPWINYDTPGLFITLNGRLLVNGTSRIRTWDLRTGREGSAFDELRGSLQPAPNGDWGISAFYNSDDEQYELEAIDLRTGQIRSTLPVIRTRQSRVLFHPDNRRVLLASVGRDSMLIDARDFRVCWRRPLSRLSITRSAFSPDGRNLAISQRRSIQILEASTGQLRMSLPLAESQRPLAFTPDGRQLATIGSTAPIYFWDLRGQLRNLPRALDRATTEHLWQDLLGDKAELAYSALQQLAAAPGTTVSFVRSRVTPVATPDAQAVERWITALEAPAFRDRQNAMKELKALADTVDGELRSARQSTSSPEVHERLSKILAATHPETPNAVRRTRIVELVEWCATPDAEQLLSEWAAGARGALLTTEAAEALTRIRALR